MPALSNIRHTFAVFGYCEEFFFIFYLFFFLREKEGESLLSGYNNPL